MTFKEWWTTNADTEDYNPSPPALYEAIWNAAHASGREAAAKILEEYVAGRKWPDQFSNWEPEADEIAARIRGSAATGGRT